MKYYFEDIEKQKELKRILDEWLGTPYRHHCGVKGLGCDCIHFVICVLGEMGIIRWRKDFIPDYPKDWHLHNTRELLCEGLERELNCEKVVLNNLQSGDITISHYGKAASHSGIYYEKYIYQSLDDIGVCKIHISDRLQRSTMKYAYRLLAK